ncbi:MAG TPA: triose-phosphate isomerase [Polyangiaceae bacterium]
MHPGRRPLIAGNWKMLHGGPSGVELAGQIARVAPVAPHVDVVIGPPFTALAACAAECDGSRVEVAAQNVYPKDSGAFTGETSPSMLVDAGCKWVIVGHSERRQHFGETDAFVAQKVKAAMAAGLTPIVCVGETLEEREAGRTLEIVERHVRGFLHLLGHAGHPAAIAYEPVWAIGTGKNAGPAEAQEVHAAIRGWLGQSSEALASGTRILYGGSVKPENARDLLAAPDVDGALVGGASLDAASFAAIVRAAEALAVR